MTMTKPEMDVVRFSESDVIVASGISSFAITGANDGTAKNMKINNVDVDKFEEIFNQTATSNSYFRYKDHKPVHIGDLDKHDVSGDLEDGLYEDHGIQQITDVINGRLWWCQ